MTIGSLACDSRKSRAVGNGTDLAAMRAAHPTKLIRKGLSPQEYQNESPPHAVRAMEYASGALKLKAWVSADPRDGKKHPAVVYVHGGFAFGAEDWDETAAYREAGFVVMTPTLRGENGNPGHFEWFYGEVDDVVAAGNALAQLPYVDAKHIYVAGHSSGATCALLAALVPSPFAASTPIGGYVNMDEFADDTHWHSVMPFDVNDDSELALRSADQFVASIRCPIRLFVGSDDQPAQTGLDDFLAAAKSAGKQCDKFQIPGDHHTSKPEALNRSAAWFSELASK
jgi:dipeptidyl aminopeptidase/acylaminoacyl peptidase